VSEPPSMTVAVPTMNGSRYLAETLRAILAQEGVTFDLLVADDCSNDDTLDVVASTAGDRARVVVNPERLGLAGNWNRCVALSHTLYVAIVHQDDVLLPGHLKTHVEAFDSDQTVGLVASASAVVDATHREVPASIVGRGGLGPIDRTFSPDEALLAMASGNPLRCSAVTLRAEAHRGVGGFDPSFRYVVDWAFWLEAVRHWSLAWRSSPTVAVRWHEASETHRFKNGTLDLDETARLLADLHAELRTRGLLSRNVEVSARRTLSRAYLNRAHVASRGGEAWLARRCLLHSVRLWPGVLGAVAADPRLAAAMAAVTVAPRLAGRWLARQP
jgi:glycosyltransferase involved in cell wall biosynthesis